MYPLFKIFINYYHNLVFLFSNNYKFYIRYVLFLVIVKLLHIFLDDSTYFHKLIDKLEALSIFKDDFDSFIDILTAADDSMTRLFWDTYKLRWEEKFSQLWSELDNENTQNNTWTAGYEKKPREKYSYTDRTISADDDIRGGFPIYIIFEIFYAWYNLLVIHDVFMHKMPKEDFFIINIFIFKGVPSIPNMESNPKLKKKIVGNVVDSIRDWSNQHMVFSYLYSWFSYDFTTFKPKTLNFYSNYTINVIIQNFKFFILFYRFFKNFLLPATVAVLFLYYSFFFFKLSFVKALANWLGLGLFVFWLLSTFNFFIKRYRFAKYTSAIQRFWKRAFMCFWLIEGFLFMIFFYYLLNASAEPFFMYDTYGMSISHLIILKTFFLNSFLVVLIINLFIYLLINVKFVTLKKNMYLLLIITLSLLYILFVESYQFYYLLNFYVEYIWNLSEDDNVWELDYDIPRTRNKNHYITLIVVAKFWHYIFIFASWVFFVMKTLELNRIRYTFLSMNLQNIILFYIMNWLCLYSWLKWIVRRFMDQSYYWFFVSFRPTTCNIVVNDFINLFKNTMKVPLSFFKNTLHYNFFYILNNLYEYTAVGMLFHYNFANIAA